MKLVKGSDFLRLAEAMTALRQLPAIGYLRGAKAALASNPPDVVIARTLIDEALAILEPPAEEIAEPEGDR